MHARSTADWQAIDRQHHLHPFTDFKALGAKGTRVITGAEGVWITDSDGHRILDGMSGLWCVNLGYGREELVEAAAAQMRELPYYNSFFQCTTPATIRLAELLAEVTPPQFQHAFLTGSGSEGNDTVIRLVRRYWQLRGEPERQVIISRENAYHGSTLGGASLGGMAPMHQQGGLPIPGIEHIMQPDWFGHRAAGGNLDAEAFGLHAAQALEERIQAIGPERIAAFIGEPVQGAGGVIIPPDSYWPEVQRICDRHGILLVADEVITGFGRTGEWFASTRFGIRPDLMTLAKGISSGYLPMGAVMVGDRVAEVLTTDGGEFAHGFTYSGHPVCAAVAVRNIELLRDEGVIEHVRDTAAPHLAARWGELADHPLVGEARTCGLVGAIELVADKASLARVQPKGRAGELCRDFAVEHGVVMRHVGEGMIIAPPLVISTAEIDLLVDRAHAALDATAAALA